MKQKTCKKRLNSELKSTLSDIRRILKEDWTGIFDYGLCFDYVPSNTFEDQEEPYFRWQLSWGGPSDEFRFFVGADLTPYRVEYWFLDWFDGASIQLEGEDRKLLLDVFEGFKEFGAIEQALKEV